MSFKSIWSGERKKPSNLQCFVSAGISHIIVFSKQFIAAISISCLIFWSTSFWNTWTLQTSLPFALWAFLGDCFSESHSRYWHPFLSYRVTFWVLRSWRSIQVLLLLRTTSINALLEREDIIPCSNIPRVLYNLLFLLTCHCLFLHIN